MTSSDTKAPGDALPALLVVTLSEYNSISLLDGALKASEQTDAESRAVLAQLRKFDPTTAQDFTFRGKATSRASFRLLIDQFSRI